MTDKPTTPQPKAPQKPKVPKKPMDLKKRELLEVSLLIVGVLTVVIIGIMQIDLTRIHGPLKSSISDALGMDVDFETINVGISQGLGFKANGLIFRSQKTKADLFKSKSLFVTFRILPLFIGILEIKNVTIAEPVILMPLPDWKSRSRRGVVNLEFIRDILRGSNLRVSGIKIKKGKIFFVKKGKSSSVDKRPLNVSFKLFFKHLDNDQLNILIEGIHIGVGKFDIEGSLKANNVLTKNSPLEIDLKANSFQAGELDEFRKLLPPALKKTLSDYSLGGNVKKLSIQGNTSLDSLEKPYSLTQVSNLTVDLKIDQMAFSLGDLKLFFPEFETNLSLSGGKLSHDIKGSLLDGEISGSGNMIFPKRLKKNGAPTIDSNLSLSKLNLALLSYYEDWMPVGGNVSGVFRINGPVAPLNKISLKGDFESANLLLSKPRGIPGPKIQFQNLSGTLEIKNGKLSHEIQGKFIDGDINAEGALNLMGGAQRKGIEIDTKVKIDSLDVRQAASPMNNEWLPEGGKLSTAFRLSGPLFEVKHLRWDGTARGTDIILNLPLMDNRKSEIAIDKIDFKGKFADGKLSLSANSNFLEGKLETEGTITFESAGDKIIPKILSEFNLTNVNMAKVKPLYDNQYIPTKGTFSSHFHLIGPLNEFDALRWAGHIRGKKITLIPWKDAKEVFISTFQGNVVWEDNKIEHDIKGNVFDGILNAKGVFHIKEKNNRTHSSINTDIKLDNISFSKVKPLSPFDWAPKGGKVTGTLKISGPMTPESDIRWGGFISGEAITFQPNNQQHIIDKITVAAKPMSSTVTELEVQADRLVFFEYPFAKAQATVDLTAESVTIKKGKIFHETGNADVTGNHQFSSSKYHFDFEGRDFRTKDFLKKYLLGSLEFSGVARGYVPDEGPATKGFSGNLKVLIKDGSILNMEGVETLVSILNPIGSLITRRKGLNFSKMEGELEVDQGVATTKDIKMEGKNLDAKLMGTIDLNDETLKLDGIAYPGKLLRVRFSISGPYEKPKVEVFSKKPEKIDQ